MKILALLLPLICSGCYATLAYEDDGRRYEVGVQIPDKHTGKQPVRVSRSK